MIVKDIAQYEENDSELAKYTIMLLQDRIDKAIEWVKKNMYYFPRPDELLNILKGSDE